MQTRKLTTIRKKTENRLENIRFQRAVQRAKNRQTMRVEHAVMHNLLYQQINPGLREQVLRRKTQLDALI